jgi:hypothetical protein
MNLVMILKAIPQFILFKMSWGMVDETTTNASMQQVGLPLRVCPQRHHPPHRVTWINNNVNAIS